MSDKMFNWDNLQTQDIRGVSMLNFLLGTWLVVSPLVFHYTSAQARWNQAIMGILVISCALIRVMAPALKWASWVNVIAGLWLLVAPFVLNYEANAAYWNEAFTATLLILWSFGNARRAAPQHPA